MIKSNYFNKKLNIKNMDIEVIGHKWKFKRKNNCYELKNLKNH